MLSELYYCGKDVREYNDVMVVWDMMMTLALSGITIYFADKLYNYAVDKYHDKCS